MRRSLALLLVLAVGAIVAGCGSAGGDEPTTSSVPATTVSVDPASGPLAVEKTADVLYMGDQENGHATVLDIHAPTMGGPWPVAVLFHPDPNYNTKTRMDGLARHLAEEGMVVFNANWGGSGRGSEGWDEVFEGQGPCVYWFAHQEASRYGGDPSDISLVGFSGGANMATAVAMFGGTIDLGCKGAQVPVEPSMVVVFEGDFLLAPWWDAAIRSDPDLYSDSTVWGYIDSYDGGPIHILVDHTTASSPQYTVTGFGSNVEDFLQLRDTDGSLTTDLTSIGALDDGDLDLTEFNTLFHHRLMQAGMPTSLTWIDSGAHTLSSEAIDAITGILFELQAN